MDVNITILPSSSSSIVTKPFILVSGGGSVTLTVARFESFESNVPVLAIRAAGALVVDEVVVTNLTFTEEGVFILGITYSNSTVQILRSNFSSLNGEGLNGTVIRVLGTTSTISVRDSAFGSSIIAANGGALYLTNSYTEIVNTTFTDCSTGEGGNGGAIYFGTGMLYTLLASTFTSCSAVYGGAIYSDSEEVADRIISSVTFSDNIVLSGGNGNDIADNSTVGFSLYSPQTIINCVSSSVASESVSNFYLMISHFNLDCLITVDGCLQDVHYVTPTGVDSIACGHYDSPCHTITRVLFNLNVSDGAEVDVVVTSGEYTSTSLSISNIDFVLYSESGIPPLLSLVAPPAGVQGW
jgi:hypothetical protein